MDTLKNKGISLTAEAHKTIQAHLKTGDIAIDATVGNGNDTLFLAKQVAANGQVFGFDIQAHAISATQEKLNQENKHDNSRLFHSSHDQMMAKIAIEFHKKINVIMFNLGYLPGSDKSLITQTESTLSALNQSISLLSTRGLITIIAYPGHSGGESEYSCIKQWCNQLSPEYYQFELIHCSDKDTAPRLFVVRTKQSCP